MTETTITDADRTPSDHETALRREATIIGVDPELPARELLDAIINWHIKLEREEINPVDIDPDDLTAEEDDDDELAMLREKCEILSYIVAGGSAPDTPDVVRDAHAWKLCAEMNRNELDHIHEELNRLGVPCWNGKDHDGYVMRIRRLAHREAVRFYQKEQSP